MQRVGARSILLAGWLLFLLYAYPGYMDTAAVDMLIDSRYRQISDWHSPMMTWVWEVVGLVIAGPAGMLLLQSGLFLFGARALLARVMSAFVCGTRILQSKPANLVGKPPST